MKHRTYSVSLGELAGEILRPRIRKIIVTNRLLEINPSVG